MTNLFFQGKIIRQFWGKLIRQSTTFKIKSLKFTVCYLGGGSLNYQNDSLSNKITFFHSVRRIE